MATRILIRCFTRRYEGISPVAEATVATEFSSAWQNSTCCVAWAYHNHTQILPHRILALLREKNDCCGGIAATSPKHPTRGAAKAQVLGAMRPTISIIVIVSNSQNMSSAYRSFKTFHQFSIYSARRFWYFR